MTTDADIRASATALQRAAERLSASKAPVRFVQIGAMDGRSFDPLHDAIIRFGWRGLLVEPVPEHFAELVRTYAGVGGLRFANVAIGETTGVATLHTVTRAAVARHGLPAWLLGISSFSADHVRDQGVFLDRERFGDIMQYVTTVEVPTVPLDALLREHDLADADVLQIDAEGFDYRILRQWDFGRACPAIVNIEFARLGESDKKATTDLLLRQGYFVALEGLDLLALRADFALPY
jgi:FkbM family methyltransferase